MDTYRIHVHSGTEGNGSDTNVSVRIVGSAGAMNVSLDRTNVVNPRGRLFYPGSEDVFEVTNSRLGRIDLLEVDHNPAYKLFVNWYVESIAVEDVTTKRTYVFPCNAWFSETKGDCRQSHIFVSRKIVNEPLHLNRDAGVSMMQMTESVTATSKQSDEGFEDMLKVGEPTETAAEGQLEETAVSTSMASMAARTLIKALGFSQTFTNWGGNVVVDTVYTFYPWRLWQVKAIIKCARWARMKVRTIGARHSWTQLYPNEETVLINPVLLRPDEGEPIEYEESSATVKILCNVTTCRAKRDQLEKNYNFMFNTVLGGVTYGGIIGTGCHGVGKHCPAHPDLIEEIQIVNSRGELVTYERSENEELIRAIGTSMGLFGFTYTITFKVEPRQHIVETYNNFSCKVGDTLLSGAAMKAIAERNFSTEIFWFPFNSNPFHAGGLAKIAEKQEYAKSIVGTLASGATCLNLDTAVGAWNPNEDEIFIKEINMKPDGEPVGDRFYQIKTAKEFLQAKLFKRFPAVIANNPWLTPLFTTFTNSAQKSCKIPGTNIELGEPKRIVQELPRAIHYRLWVHEGFQVYDFEMAFIVNDDYENIAQACKDVVDIVKEYAGRNEFPMSLALEMRFMSDSKSLLCPAVVGRTKPDEDAIKVAYVEVLALGNSTSRPLWVKFTKEVAKKWMSVDGVKPLPHWAKMSELEPTPELVQYLWENNGKNMQKFLDLLEASNADPGKMFFNEYLETILTKPK